MRWAIVFSGVSAAAAVAIGAASAHGHADLSNLEIRWIDTALRYQIWNTLGLLAVGILGHIWQSSRILTISGIALATGITLFSGSLYIMATTQIQNLGAVTPIGGLSLIAGWLLLALAALRQRLKENPS